MSNEAKVISLLVKGNLKKNNGIISVCIPHKEMQYNLWRIKISEISFICNEQATSLCLISTNYVNEVCYDKFKQQTYYKPPLSHLLLSGKLKEQSSVQKQQEWLYITSFKEELELYFRLVIFSHK